MVNAWISHLKEFYAKNKSKMSYKDAMKEAKKTYSKGTHKMPDGSVMTGKVHNKNSKLKGGAYGSQGNIKMSIKEPKVETQKERLSDKTDRRKVVSKYNKLKTIVQKGLREGELLKKEFDAFAEYSNILGGESRTNKYAKLLSKLRKEFASKKFAKLESKNETITDIQLEKRKLKLEKIVSQDKTNMIAKGKKGRQLELLRQSGLSGFGRTDSDIARVLRRREMLRRLGKSDNEIKRILEDEEKQRVRTAGSVIDPRLEQFVMSSGFLNKKGRNKVDRLLRKVGRNDQELDLKRITDVASAFKSLSTTEDTLSDITEVSKLPITEAQKRRLENVEKALNARLVRIQTLKAKAKSGKAKAKAPAPTAPAPAPAPTGGAPAPAPRPPTPPPTMMMTNPVESDNDKINAKANVGDAKAEAKKLGFLTFIFQQKTGSKETKIYQMGSRGKFVVNKIIDPSSFDYSTWYGFPIPLSTGSPRGSGSSTPSTGIATPPLVPVPAPIIPPVIRNPPSAAEQAEIDGKTTVKNAKLRAKQLNLSKFLFTTGGKRKEYNINPAGNYIPTRVVANIPAGGGGGGAPVAPAPVIGMVPPTSTTTFHNPTDQAEFEAIEKSRLADALRTGKWMPISFENNVYKYDSSIGSYVVEQLNNSVLAQPTPLADISPTGNVPAYTNDGSAEQTQFINLKDMLNTRTEKIFEDELNNIADNDTNFSQKFKDHMGQAKMSNLAALPFGDAVNELLQDPALEDYMRKYTEETLYKDGSAKQHLNDYKDLTGFNYDVKDIATPSEYIGAGFGDLVKEKMKQKHLKKYKKPSIKAPKVLADRLHQLLMTLDKNFGHKHLDHRLKSLHIDSKQTFHKEYLKIIREIRETIGKLKLSALRTRQSTESFDDLAKDLDHFHKQQLPKIEERIGGKRASENNIILNELNELHGGNLFNAIGDIKNRGSQDNNPHSNYIKKGIQTLFKKGKEMLANKMNADPYNNISQGEHGQIANHIGKFLYSKIYKYQKPNIKPMDNPKDVAQTQAGLAGGAFKRKSYNPTYNLNNPMYSNAPQIEVPSVGGNRKVFRNQKRANHSNKIGGGSLGGGDLPSGHNLLDTRPRSGNNFFKTI